MSIAATIRKLIADGFTVEQALAAAEAFEASMKPERTARQERQSLGFDVDEWERRRQLVFERDGYVCVYCGTDVSARPQCDHVVPLVQGGNSEIDNLATSCKRCNSSKSGRRPDEWVRPCQ